MPDKSHLTPRPMSVRRLSITKELIAPVRESVITTLEESDEGMTKINQFRLVRYIGKGAYGTVHLAVDENTGIEYAIKIFSKARLRKVQWSMNSRQRTLFGHNHPSRRHSSIATPLSPEERGKYGEDEDIIKREIAILKRLKHPNCVKLVEVVEDQTIDEIYMVFEMCHGGPIMNMDLNQDCQPLPEPVARDFFQQMILGLEYIHEHHIIHRDLKPENLLLSKDKELKIADFGVSMLFDVSDVISKSVGSPAFLAPEMCTRNSKAYSGCAADIWAMGVTLYCMVVGHVPFTGKSIVELYDNITNQPLHIPETIEQDLRALLLGLLERKPVKRLTLDQVRCHPWVTNHGQIYLLPKAENVAVVVRPEDITQQEITSAITGIHSVLTILKFVQKLKRRLGRRQRRALSCDSLAPLDNLSISTNTATITTTSSSSSSSNTSITKNPNTMTTSNSSSKNSISIVHPLQGSNGILPTFHISPVSPTISSPVSPIISSWANQEMLTPHGKY